MRRKFVVETKEMIIITRIVTFAYILFECVDFINF